MSIGFFPRRTRVSWESGERGPEATGSDSIRGREGPEMRSCQEMERPRCDGASTEILDGLL